MLASFTEYEKDLLYGKTKPLADKHKCSPKYVKFIVMNERNINTKLAKEIYEDLKALLKIYKPNI
ncbi:MAG: hypothetical protein COB73_00930 [Flavobacteriaceae bacterium]|nr:MAG: hypothetical protein COB73_00930 [Flavobacteriaceae bacterium]